VKGKREKSVRTWFVQAESGPPYRGSITSRDVLPGAVKGKKLRHTSDLKRGYIPEEHTLAGNIKHQLQVGEKKSTEAKRSNEIVVRTQNQPETGQEGLVGRGEVKMTFSEGRSDPLGRDFDGQRSGKRRKGKRGSSGNCR